MTSQVSSNLYTLSIDCDQYFEGPTDKNSP